MRPRHRQPPPRLVRRAIPPRRGRIRKRYVVLLIVLLGLGWLGWVIAGAITARPGPLVDYQQKMLDLSAGMQPEGENGWPAFIEALTLYSMMGRPDVPDWPTDAEQLANVQYLTRVLAGEFDPQRLRFELALLAHLEQSGVLEALDAAAAAPRAVREVLDGADQGVMFTLLPELSQTRAVARMCAARMRASQEAGDTEQFLRSAEHALALARISSHDPFYISHLVGIAVSSLTLSELGHQMVEKELDEATCRRLLEMLDRHARAPMSFAFEAERMSQLDVIQRTYSDDGHGDGILLMSRAAEMANMFGGAPPMSGTHPVFNVVGLVLPGRAETTRLLNEFFDAAVEQSELPGPQRRNHPVNLDVFVDNLPRGHIVLQLLLPALSRGLSADLNARALHDATRLLLAIEGFEARHGRLPDSLDDLAPDFLASVPLDPVSGKPFGFVRRRPTAEDSRTYWLYSIGLDGTDNGGTESPGDDEMAALRSEPEGNGFDYVFNRLRGPWEEEETTREPAGEAPDPEPEAPADTGAQEEEATDP